MKEPEAVVPAPEHFQEFYESSDIPGDGLPSLHTEALDGIRKSPFKEPYPVQRPGDTLIADYAGELRGYYRRADGSDRWKPSWSGFGQRRDQTDSCLLTKA